MLKEKIIVIGCDDPAILSVLLTSIHKEEASYSFNIITVATTGHLMSILQSLNPDLFVLLFRSNKMALTQITPLVNRIKIPVLCVINKFETEMEYLSLNSSVFTYPLDHIKNVEYLNSRIRSLFFLGANNPIEQAPRSMADAAYKKHEPSDKRYLSRYVLELDQKVEILSKIKNKITGLSGLADNPVRNELLSIVNAIKRSLSNKDLWEDFKLFYQEADPDFLLLLARKYPFLTAVDLKYCCYLKMNMTNDDIRKIFGISLESVRTHKHRLKKKMALSKEQDLLSFLRSIN